LVDFRDLALGLRRLADQSLVVVDGNAGRDPPLQLDDRQLRLAFLLGELLHLGLRRLVDQRLVVVGDDLVVTTWCNPLLQLDDLELGFGLLPGRRRLRILLQLLSRYHKTPPSSSKGTGRKHSALWFRPLLLNA